MVGSFIFLNVLLLKLQRVIYVAIAFITLICICRWNTPVVENLIQMNVSLLELLELQSYIYVAVNYASLILICRRTHLLAAMWMHLLCNTYLKFWLKRLIVLLCECAFAKFQQRYIHEYETPNNSGLMDALSYCQTQVHLVQNAGGRSCLATIFEGLTMNMLQYNFLRTSTIEYIEWQEWSYPSVCSLLLWS